MPLGSPSARPQVGCQARSESVYRAGSPSRQRARAGRWRRAANRTPRGRGFRTATSSTPRWCSAPSCAAAAPASLTHHLSVSAAETSSTPNGADAARRLRPAPLRDPLPRARPPGSGDAPPGRGPARTDMQRWVLAASPPPGTACHLAVRARGPQASPASALEVDERFGVQLAVGPAELQASRFGGVGLADDDVAAAVVAVAARLEHQRPAEPRRRQS